MRYTRRIRSNERKKSMSEVNLLESARSGNEDAFNSLIEQHRHELIVHCYRVFGSIQDAEDMVQETILRAWQRLETFADRGTFRSWLYRIATNICLDTLRKRTKQESIEEPDASSSEELVLDESIWVDALPNKFISELVADPEATYTQQESVALAFVRVLQILPPRQRSILILRDVLNWRASEVADLLNITGSSVTSALHRARVTMKNNYGKQTSSLSDTEHNAMLTQYIEAWQNADVDQLVSLLKDDAIFGMPPQASWLSIAFIRKTLSQTLFAGSAKGRWQMHRIEANNQLAFAIYHRDDEKSHYDFFGIQVLTIDETKIARVDNYIDPTLFSRFDLPQTRV